MSATPNPNPTPNAEEDKKPNDIAHINLKVKGQDGNEVFFRIKRNTQLKKLMNAYCDRQSVDLNSIAFIFDGWRLRAEQTPDELEMEDGDEIDAMLHQTGSVKANCQSFATLFE
ncbi:small ubiquitin-related modifier 1-like [Trifolium pratense]|uniref:small ubiquitin-related modifier 1-like n=1 Tax=Trifolium pratense TaxID=57577 RepID=UPI001E6978A1|nr:small ubiquitin-related modifier 1-like [Trifolium pratense]